MTLTRHMGGRPPLCVQAVQSWDGSPEKKIDSVTTCLGILRHD
jgi:hypothetical protein